MHGLILYSDFPLSCFSQKQVPVQETEEFRNYSFLFSVAKAQHEIISNFPDLEFGKHSHFPFAMLDKLGP